MIKRLFVIAVVVMGTFLFVSCDEEAQVQAKAPVMMQQKASATKKLETSKDFKVPENSAGVSSEKAKLYAKASQALVELGAQWSERIEKAADQDKVEILEAYSMAREEVCSKIGLSGLAEYNWLDSVALKDPANAEVFAEAGVKKTQ